MKHWVHLGKDSTCLDFGMGGEREGEGRSQGGKKRHPSFITSSIYDYVAFEVTSLKGDNLQPGSKIKQSLNLKEK